MTYDLLVGKFGNIFKNLRFHLPAHWILMPPIHAIYRRVPTRPPGCASTTQPYTRGRNRFDRDPPLVLSNEAPQVLSPIPDFLNEQSRDEEHSHFSVGRSESAFSLCFYTLLIMDKSMCCGGAFWSTIDCGKTKGLFDCTITLPSPGK